MTTHNNELEVKKHQMLARVKSNSNGSIRLFGTKFATESPTIQDPILAQISNPSETKQLLSKTKSISCAVCNNIQNYYPTNGHVKIKLDSDLEKGLSKGHSTDTQEEFLKMTMKREILKAKAEAKTVSVISGKLYIDYRLVGPLPDGVRI